MAPAAKAVGGIALVAALSVGLVLVHDFLTQCDYFRAETVSIMGCRHLDRKTVFRQARVAPGINILSVNLTLARNRLLAHPWIADAQVSRELPDGLYIQIEEHVPLAILDMKGGRRFIINRDGDIFKKYETSDRLDVPVIGGLEFMDLPLPGRPGSDVFRAVMTVLEMGRQSATVLPNHTIRGIRVDREMGLTLLLPVGAPGPFNAVKLGYGDYPVKYRRLREIIDFLKREGSSLRIDAIDLKDLNRIVINPAVKNAAEDSGREIQPLSEDQKEV